MSAFKDLLEDQVRDLAPIDLDPGDAAWRRAARLRRRRTTLAAGSLAALAVAVVAVAGTTGRGPDTEPGPGPATQGTSRSPSGAPSASGVSTRPDGRYRGTPVFWSPLPSEEDSLPALDLGLPDEIDLATEELAADDMDSAVAAFAVMGEEGIERFMLLDEGGRLHTVDVDRIGVDAQTWPVSDGMLSPGGTRLAFPQADGVHVLTLATAAWRVVGPPDAENVGWESDDVLAVFAGGARRTIDVDGRSLPSAVPPVPAFVHTDAEGYGFDARARSGGRASAWWGPTDLEAAPRGFTPVQVLAVQDRGDRPVAFLVQREDVPDAVRQKQCCSPAFWAGGRVVYRSTGDVTRLLAWRPGTHEFARVSTITGTDPGVTSVVASFRQTGW